MKRTPQEELESGLRALAAGNIRAITMSRAVSHYAGPRFRDCPPSGPRGLAVLRGLRRTMSGRAAAARNVAEEGALAMAHERRYGAGSAYEAGFTTTLARRPRFDHFIERALAAGFADDPDSQAVRSLCEAWLARA